MSNRQDDSSKKAGARSRRSLIAGAAVAAAALPLVSVTSSKAQGHGTRVVVDLGGVELPRQLADNLESDIRRAVLMAVARAQPRTKFKNLPLGPGIRGIMIRPIELGAEPHM